MSKSGMWVWGRQHSSPPWWKFQENQRHWQSVKVHLGNILVEDTRQSFMIYWLAKPTRNDLWDLFQLWCYIFVSGVWKANFVFNEFHKHLLSVQCSRPWKAHRVLATINAISSRGRVNQPILWLRLWLLSVWFVKWKLISWRASVIYQYHPWHLVMAPLTHLP